ncbi:vitamin B12 ABC transporter, B12-binding component BtuF [Jeotgalibacillus malaysiensis]|uniref:Vitamin B12 ABC transporter, B12-binding component BtuF n=1 Tax=Jeotgalibacillus malaysiensis TaxID=1508404 RepID=A0A0B5AQM8_9BACL|nr:ABC transporter substrate-binding protein [Jeotgalibacillus malaysiensis]AJD92391.1 vitamin B12 ABC transporter, B12-binding component BtuF [Jeotgalibacillus malaysiensis]
MKKWLPVLLAAGVLAACSDSTEETTEAPADDQEQEESAEEPAESDSSFPVTVTDANGDEITIEEQPDAIVSMLPSNTEIAYALGLDEEIVGVSDFDNYPEEAMDVEKIGGMEFNVEKIIALQPDVVLAHASNPGGADGLQQIEDAGIPVVVIENAMTFDEVYDTIDMIGQVTGTTEEAEQIVADMQAGFDEIAEKASAISEEDRKSVLVDVAGPPEMYVAANNTFIQEMLDLINAENVMADQEGFVPLTEEEVVSRNPEVALLTYGDFVEDAVAQWMGYEGFSQVTAVTNEDVYLVPSDPVTRSGPRLVEGTQALAEAVYPDVFAE